MLLKYLVPFCVAGLAAVPAAGQSSLGISGAEFRLGVESGFADTAPAFDGVIDVAVTEVHGFQADLTFADGTGGAIGRVGGHLYMTPEARHKYGLFGFAADVDGASMFYGAIGAEGMIGLSEHTVVEGRAGAGLSEKDGLDFVFASIGISHDVSDTLRIGLSADLAEFDEPAFEAIGSDVTLSLRYNPKGTRLGAFAEIQHSDLSGRDGAPGEVSLRAGVSITFGRVGTSGVRGTPFRQADPVAQLVRRGIY